MNTLTLESLAKRVTELEREVKLARSAAAGSLSVSANQQGPLPGWLTAGQFGPGVMARSSLHIKNDSNQPGSSPRLTVTNASGTVQVEIGNLAAYTDPRGVQSPAEFGLRAIDASGNLIFDSVGISSIGALLANDQATNNSSPTAPSSPSWLSLPGSGTTFTVSRALPVLLLMVAQGNTASGATQNVRYHGKIFSGSGTGGTVVGDVGGGLWPFNNQAFNTLVGTLPVLLPGGGTYTVAQQIQSTGTAQQINLGFGSLQLIQLGS